jgi:hypothetical protein
MEHFTFISLNRVAGRRHTFHMVGTLPPHGQLLRASRPQVDIVHAHNLWKGAASAAICIGVPFLFIKYMGGWAKNNSVTEGKYIDPTMTPSLAALRFFG